MSKEKIKSDSCKNSRGGPSKILSIYCSECDSFICKYQKDGTGILRRMYIDRIRDSKVPVSEKSLSCNNKHIIGVKIIYKKEKRLAFRLITGSFIKK